MYTHTLSKKESNKPTQDMKRVFICQEEKAVNPLLELPRELLDTFIALNSQTPFEFLASLLKLYMVNRDSYARLESIRRTEVLEMIKKCRIKESLQVFTPQKMYGIWSKISCVALCHASYKEIIDDYFDSVPGFEIRFVECILEHVRKTIHPHQYKEANVNFPRLTKNRAKLPSSLQRLLAYHCAVMATLNSARRTIVRRVDHHTNLCDMYVYNDANRIDNNAKYLVKLYGDESTSIDLRYLTPLCLPFAYNNNEMLYAVENVPESLGRAEHFLHPLGKVGKISPPLEIERLLKRIRKSEAFCEVLKECRRALATKKTRVSRK